MQDRAVTSWSLLVLVSSVSRRTGEDVKRFGIVVVAIMGGGAG
jgi:hypothetical protein